MKKVFQKIYVWNAIIKEFYYLNINSIKFEYENNNKFIDCANSTNKFSNFYFNKINQDYDPCYYTCSRCEYRNDRINSTKFIKKAIIYIIILLTNINALIHANVQPNTT